ncbi:D-alanyl-D-alanine carboxypeptidase [Candidatus Synechococcus calcipolaris G9]|uniref:D-alanyl-D-alanine carboxypeptidase n=1 Tax=Candidatus Synechococcus calcipolaris G9 TaxID=1497997 RepID=A0ABT6F1H2_9SYNE|nr:D-alanyl-D-alanine carboxypeptidase [Candidatus Synechococcus calcipolaris]MDG2991710.1 D-alanyl-D-alanine carboxypeptidase [Candidatus Synechococcus calcipolaris G9]
MLELLATVDLLWQATTGQAILNETTLATMVFPREQVVQQRVTDYLEALEQKGIPVTDQGVWLQTQDQLLVNHQGDRPLSAASITKIATTLAILDKFPPHHEFLTRFGTTGDLVNGVVKGDLVIVGSNDPLFVWEEAIMVANALNDLGIRQIDGNVVIVPPFAMNYTDDPGSAGVILKQAMDSRQWPGELQDTYNRMAPGTPRPQLAIAGQVMITETIPADTKFLLEHRSLPLVEILRQMNIYSNNDMSEMLADMVGGGPVLGPKVAEMIGVPTQEIQLINGSGLGDENRISPRAACGMFQMLQTQLGAQNLSLADILPMAGRDGGTLDYRTLPQSTLVKTGTLWNVSALTGIIPTQKYGTVCFSIINGGPHLDGFRQEQENLVQGFMDDLGRASTLPLEFQGNSPPFRLGDRERNRSLTGT